MKRLLTLSVITILLACAFSASSVAAQTYYFRVDSLIVDVFWESDGTATIQYQMTLTNDVSADPMAYVDIGLPTEDYSSGQVQAWIGSTPIQDIGASPYVEPGIALGLGSNAIPPGVTESLTAVISGVGGVMYRADEPAGYASVQFSPSWFDSQYVYGTTDMTVAFHLPPGVKPDEPRWFKAPSGWPEEPQRSLDDAGRVVYLWQNPQANGYTQYIFGAAFPASYVPAEAIASASLLDRLGIHIDEEAMPAFACCIGFGVLMALFVGVGIWSDRRRRLAYLPPKLAIEGHGIKRGLTAVEAAVLLQTPLDKVLTMILFAVIKKGAARVVTEEPFVVERISPQPADLRTYEKSFLEAVCVEGGKIKRKELQEVVVQLIKSVQNSMKGFSLGETRDYYRSIVRKAWDEVEQAKTPEVRSEKFAEALEWTMMDGDFEGRTRRTFRTGPVYVPIWWGNYRPSSVPSAGKVAGPAGAPARPSGAGVSLPRLPGADFAASVVSGVQNTAGKLVSNVASFTTNVTQVTNPPPKVSYSSSRGGGRSGGGCACACACAGCACACAGGGR